MELFKFDHSVPEDSTDLSKGEPITGYNSAIWTERYRTAGEFQITALFSSKLKEFLPLGTIITHVDTYELMCVESHDVPEKKNEDPTITISGRSLETILENRIVGSNQTYPITAPWSEYQLPTNFTWVQIVNLINDHISGTVDPDDEIDGIVAVSAVPGSGVAEPRSVKRGDVYKKVLELLAIDNLGIRIYRKNPFGIVGSATDTQFVIHKGNDKTASVILSWSSGDIDEAGYFWSQKNEKNSALVQSKYFEIRVDDATATKYNRRMMYVEAKDLDEVYGGVPGSIVEAEVLAKMAIRGQEAIAAQKLIALASANVSANLRYRYRKDYDIGDLVTVDGNYGETGVMRVVANTEIQDETGFKSYPTLELLEA